MIDNKNKYILTALSATSVLLTMSATNVHAAEKIGEVSVYSLNVRSGPSTSYRVIGSLKKGNEITIISSQDGWYKIKYKSTTGWISRDYVQIKSSSVTEGSDSTTNNKKLVATANLNVRSGDSTSYKVIGYIRKNNMVEMLGVANSGWYKVKLSDGTIGYASNLYLKESSSNLEDSSNNTSNNVDNNLGNNTTVIETLVATANLNFRSGPSTSNSIVGVVYKGDKVSVIEHTNNNWYKAKLSNGKVGYCSTKYLKSQNDIDSSTNKPTSDKDIAYTLDVKAYAYYTGTITATGTKPTFGRTIAVDPKVIPYGTRIYIPEFDKTFIAEDCGGAIKGNKIDIYMNTREECINWGVRNITLYILK
ncbi:SH3 domain-containing protein [Terrisporobacter sp.]